MSEEIPFTRFTIHNGRGKRWYTAESDPEGGYNLTLRSPDYTIISTGWVATAIEARLWVETNAHKEGVTWAGDR